MRFLVFWVLCAPVALVSGAACGSEPNKRPQGPAPVYEPWVVASWAVESAASGHPDALDVLLEDQTPPVQTTSHGQDLGSGPRVPSDGEAQSQAEPQSHAEPQSTPDLRSGATPSQASPSPQVPSGASPSGSATAR